MSLENKIKIIDEICERHPSIGTKKGWSEYVGGMADTGRWFFRKMLDVPEEELMVFLAEIIKEENTPVIPMTEQQIADSKIIHHLPGGHFITELFKKDLEKYNREREMDMLFGPNRDKL